MSDSKALSRIAQLLEVFSVFADAGLSVAGARALLFIAMASSDYQNPMLPSVADVSKAVQMSPSGTSRLLSHLVLCDDACISSDKGIKDSRSESFFLTTRGKELVEAALALLYVSKGSASVANEDVRIEPLDLSTYAKSKYVERNGRSDLFLERWQDLVVETRNDGPKILVSHDNNKNAIESHIGHLVPSGETTTLEFTNRSQALLFLCKNCLPIRPFKG